MFWLRQMADLQTNTIYRDLRRELRNFSGDILDIGCGNSPFRHLLDPKQSRYQGIDINAAAKFGYDNPDTVYYDGQTIPFKDNSFDGIICTEVLEHVPDPVPFIAELYRVLKPKGLAIITIPWSARYHYQPYDYHRYTPSTLLQLFDRFCLCNIHPRGTDLSSIASKVVVAYSRNVLRLAPRNLVDALKAPFRLIALIALAPFLATALVFGHLGIYFGLGSPDDPLGYTLVLKK